jgi:hypothetical protein
MRSSAMSRRVSNGRAQAIKGRTDFTVELAADPKQPALDQARQSEQDADTRHRTESWAMLAVIDQIPAAHAATVLRTTLRMF